jgi:cobalt-zinc-cadmium efflux system outer membrane protein
MCDLNSARCGWLLLILVVLLCLPDVRAESAPPTLGQAVQAAFERYPEAGLAQVINEQGAAIRQQASALLAGDPALVLRHESDAVTDDNGFRQWEGGLEMPLWLPGQRQRRGRVADATQSEGAATLRAQRWEVAGEIRELLWSLAIAAAELELATQARQATGALERDVERRVAAGELARMDLILAQKETLAREIERAAAASQHSALLMQYRAVTGLSAVPAELTETAAATDDIVAEHPALVAAQVAAERNRAERDQVRGEKRASPVLTLGGKSERPESGLSYDNAVILEVNVPLGTAGQAAPRTAAAERSLAEATAAVARARLDLEQDLNLARTARQQAQQALQLAQRQQQLAAEGLRLAQRAFELGENSLFMVLDARRQALASERMLRVSELELGRAVARYNQALGVIPE